VSVSVCCLTRDAGPRVAAVLGALRPVVDEIVVAADVRVGREDLAWYASVADIVHRIEFRWLERHLPWLHARCSGDWILRLDGDEVVGPEFVDALPALAADPLVDQYWFRRRWLFPDAAHWLDEPPWGADFQCRLVRRSGRLRFPGEQHTGAARSAPARYLDLPFYHLVCLLATPSERSSKSLRYEVTRPNLQASGGGSINDRYYFPERHARLAPAPVPEHDRAVIDGALAARGRCSTPAPERPVVPLAELDVLWPGRRLAETAYAATISPLERDYRMSPGERRELYFRITNDGDTHWHWDAELEPVIRAGYRWFEQDGTCLVAEAARTSFPAVVWPGETAIVPLDVTAPSASGTFVLEVDLVHEHARWFDTPLRVRVDVVERLAARARGAASAPRPSGQIPRVVHRIWLGGRPLPAEFRRYEETWRAHHPRWDHRLWGDHDLHRLVPAEALSRCRHDSERSDLLRYEILRRFGGVYVDTDVECLKPLDALLEGVVAFAGYETPGRAGTAVLGCVAGHAAFAEAAEEARETAGLGAHSADATGPYFFSLVAERHSDVTLFPPTTFYPFSWDDAPVPGARYDDSYAVHHWARSWL
jgi:inositol phosphorylceramide mannosyltransferase catalytic subunit